jgi:hypothetical protein
MRRHVWLLVGSLAISPFLWCQTSATQISGVVEDSAGSPIPDAAITIINSATSAVRNVVTGSVGDYAISNLPAGDYQLKVAKPGFSTYLQTGIVLKVEVNPLPRYWRARRLRFD